MAGSRPQVERYGKIKMADGQGSPTAEDAGAQAPGLKGLVQAILKKPVRNGSIFAGFALICLAAALAMSMLTTEPPPNPVTVAMDKLKEGKFGDARIEISAAMAKGELTQEEENKAYYIMGRSVAGEAEEEEEKDKRQGLYYFASRYLLEAFHRGFDPEYKVEGTFYLAKTTFECGRKTPSLPYFQEVVESSDSKYRPISQTYLARIYLEDPYLEKKRGRDHIDEYLKNENLTTNEKDQAQIIKARLFYAESKLDEALESLANANPTSKVRAEEQLLRGQVMLKQALAELEGQQAADADFVLADNIKEMLKKAATEFRKAQATGASNSELVTQARFCEGICQLNLSDFARAQELFSDVRRDNVDPHLAVAAGIEEAELNARQNKVDDAFNGYMLALLDGSRLGDLNSQWIDSKAIEKKVTRFIETLIEGKKFDEGLSLSKRMWPPLSRDEGMRMQAWVRENWARDYLASSETKEGEERLKLKSQASAQYREAATAHYKLAQLRKGEPTYLQHLSDSAESNYLGHDYERSINIFKQLLEADVANRQPFYLIRIAESQLAAGNFDESLEMLNKCIAQYPTDPSTYKARLISSRIFLELRKIPEAKQMLLDNLESDILTPQSIEWRESLLAMGRTLFHEALELEAQSRSLGVDSEDTIQKEEGLKVLETSHVLFQEAIRKLQEARQRYGDDPRIEEYRYLLAESYRQSAKWPIKKLPTIAVATARAGLQEQARTDLAHALEHYTTVISHLSNLQEKPILTDIEKKLLRNSYFARADILYDLEDYSKALEAYSSAANQYNDRPECLEAFVRMFSCHRKLKQDQNARTVLAQARLFLDEKIDPNLDFAKTTRYSRDQWRNLLDLMGAL